MKNVKEFTTKIEGEAWSNALDRAFNKKKKILRLMVLEKEQFQKMFISRNLVLKYYSWMLLMSVSMMHIIRLLMITN